MTFSLTSSAGVSRQRDCIVISLWANIEVGIMSKGCVISWTQVNSQAHWCKTGKSVKDVISYEEIRQKIKYNLTKKKKKKKDILLVETSGIA